MDRLIHANPFDHNSDLVDAPTASAAHWWSTLGAIAGRSLTAEEIGKSESLAEAGYSLRHTAERMFGAERTDKHFAP